MTFLHTMLAFVLALGVLVAFHELGHYFAARICGVKVLRYCLGFGSPVFSRRFGKDQTEWAIAALPLGGYVKLLGQDPEDDIPNQDRHRSFSAQPVGRRMFIIVAGPLANLLLAVAVYWGLNLQGVEEPRARVAQPEAGTAAAAAGLQAGDTIERIDATGIRSWADLSWQLLQAANDRRVVALEVARDPNRIVLVRLDLTLLSPSELEGDFMKKAGFRLFRPPPRISSLEAGAPAERAGLQVEDRILAVNGQSVVSAEDFVRTMRANHGRELTLDVSRSAGVYIIQIVPARVERDGQVFGRIGAGLDDRPALLKVHYGPGEGLVKAVVHTWEMSIFSLKMLGRMLIGEVSWKNLSGPVTIADYAGKTARLGVTYYLNFVALVSISLGVLNLLPIPVLDGGYLMYYSIEAIRRKPVPPGWMEAGTRFGLAVVILAMSLALFNDISRLLAG